MTDQPLPTVNSATDKKPEADILSPPKEGWTVDAYAEARRISEQDAWHELRRLCAEGQLAEQSKNRWIRYVKPSQTNGEVKQHIEPQNPEKRGNRDGQKAPAEDDKIPLKRKLEAAKREVEELGGLDAVKSGAWFLPLVQKCFGNYYERATADYFAEKYPGANDDDLIKKLTSVAARNCAIVGGLAGLAVSADEVAAVFATLPSGGLTLPAQIAIAATSIAAELVVVTRFQLKLVAEIAKAMKVPLNPEDPEDILVIFAFAVGGGVTEVAGKAGMKVAAKATERVIRSTIKKEVLANLKSVAAKLGLKLLQRSIIKYTVPIVSILLGSGWNYTTTKGVAKIARKHFEQRL